MLKIKTSFPDMNADYYLAIQKDENIPPMIKKRYTTAIMKLCSLCIPINLTERQILNAIERELFNSPKRTYKSSIKSIIHYREVLNKETSKLKEKLEDLSRLRRQ